MELLVTVRKREKFEVLCELVDGIIIGSYFTSGYKLTKKDMAEITSYAHNRSKKVYVVIDDFISESEKGDFLSYFDFVVGLEPDGIYYHDLAVVNTAKKYGIVNKLIYDGKTIICNSLETTFYLRSGINSVVLSRELTLDEIMSIVQYYPGMIDMQVFGHIRMSYSKRKFLSNYFHEIGSYYDYSDSENLSLTEENRDYHMPIVQDDSGTKIYSDYIFEVYEEFTKLRPFIKRGIVDTYFIEDGIVLQALRDYRRINDFNAQFLKNALSHKQPERFSTGYLYLKTNKTKDGKN